MDHLFALSPKRLGRPRSRSVSTIKTTEIDKRTHSSRRERSPSKTRPPAAIIGLYPTTPPKETPNQIEKEKSKTEDSRVKHERIAPWNKGAQVQRERSRSGSSPAMMWTERGLGASDQLAVWATPDFSKARKDRTRMRDSDDYLTVKYPNPMTGMITPSVWSESNNSSDTSRANEARARDRKLKLEEARKRKEHALKSHGKRWKPDGNAWVLVEAKPNPYFPKQSLFTPGKRSVSVPGEFPGDPAIMGDFGSDFVPQPHLPPKSDRRIPPSKDGSKQNQQMDLMSPLLTPGTSNKYPGHNEIRTRMPGPLVSPIKRKPLNLDGRGRSNSKGVPVTSNEARAMSVPAFPKEESTPADTIGGPFRPSPQSSPGETGRLRPFLGERQEATFDLTKDFLYPPQVRSQGKTYPSQLSRMHGGQKGTQAVSNLSQLPPVNLVHPSLASIPAQIRQQNGSNPPRGASTTTTPITIITGSRPPRVFSNEERHLYQEQTIYHKEQLQPAIMTNRPPPIRRPEYNDVVPRCVSTPLPACLIPGMKAENGSIPPTFMYMSPTQGSLQPKGGEVMINQHGQQAMEVNDENREIMPREANPNVGGDQNRDLMHLKFSENPPVSSESKLQTQTLGSPFKEPALEAKGNGETKEDGEVLSPVSEDDGEVRVGESARSPGITPVCSDNMSADDSSVRASFFSRRPSLRKAFSEYENENSDAKKRWRTAMTLFGYFLTMLDNVYTLLDPSSAPNKVLREGPRSVTDCMVVAKAWMMAAMSALVITYMTLLSSRLLRLSIDVLVCFLEPLGIIARIIGKVAGR